MRASVGDSLLERAAWTAYAVGRAPLERRVPFRSRGALERAQARRVRAALAFAYAHVPYYSETMRRVGLTPEMFRTAADLARLPLIEREHLQRDPDRFTSRPSRRGRYVQLATDGTSGAPVVVLHDPFALFQGAAHYQRAEAVVLRLASRRVILRRVNIGLPSDAIERTSSAVRRRSLVSPGLRYRDLHLSMADPPAENAARVLEFAPDELSSYGSYLDALVVELSRAGQTRGLPRVASFEADSISALARKTFADELGIPVLSRYSAGEAHHIGFECEEHAGLHINEDICPVRIVDADGNQVPDGQPGEVVISNLVNRGTVLLNYRLGDVAAWLGSGCSCGRTLGLMSFPQGRTDEWCLSASGELVHGQEVRGLLLADDAYLLRFQVVQETPHQFSVTVVTRAGCDREAFRAGVERRFGDRFGPDIHTRVRFVEDLPRTPNGKVRTIVSRAGVRRPPPVRV